MIRYQTICANLLKDLPPRTIDVIERRFGLKGGSGETLEAIGGNYDITRERVRQIEEEGFSKIKSRLKNYQKVFQYFSDILESAGGFQKEDILLSSLGGKKYQNHSLFFLTLGEGFERYPEDDNFYALWAIGKNPLISAKKFVNSAIGQLNKEKKTLTFDDFFKVQKFSFYKILGDKANKDIFSSCLGISKQIQKNGEGEFGLRHWVEINPRGIKDKAYLVLKKQGEPLHFTQVASFIENSPCFEIKKAHRATVHNELIKDSRFVLVGRGLYGLTEWGYQPGLVKDVISRVLKQAKCPMDKESIIKEVLKQRIVKENTILLNLQDKNHFLKNEEGRYIIKES